MLGLERSAARLWFAALAGALPAGWILPGRVRRPPTDPVNSLLSLGYTLLTRRAETACGAWGLDPAVGFLHAYRAGRPALACDLVEPFRVPAVDRLVVSALHGGRLSTADFTDTADDGVRLTEEAFRRWLGLFEGNMHAAESGSPSLQTRLLDRARQLAESLPPAGPPFAFVEETDESDEP